MKAVFIHDNKITQCNSKLYSSGSLNEQIINRYFRYFSILTLVTRVDNNRSVQNLSFISDCSNVTFVPIKDLAKLNPLSFLQNYVELKKVISQNDIFIIRLPSLIGFLAGFILLKKKNVLMMRFPS